jgi:hypothetical protein
MARPARVRIRRRKPCFLCRRRLFGWNVRLLTGMTPVTRDHEMSTNPLIDLPLVQSCTPLKNQCGPAGSAARNGRLNTDRPTVRGRLWTGQTSDPQGFPQACGQNSRRTTGQPVVTHGSHTMITLRRPPDTPEVAPNFGFIACG